MGNAPEDLILQYALHVLLAQAVGRRAVVDDELHLRLGDGGGPQHLQGQSRVLDAGDVHAGYEEDEARLLQCGGDDLVESAGRVDDDVVVALGQQLDDLLDVLGRQVAPLTGVQGRGQDVDAAVMLYEVVAYLVAVHLVQVARHVGDTLLHRHVHHDRHVAEAGVHVHQHDCGACRADQGGGQVGGDGGLANAPLGAEDGDDGPVGRRLRRLARHAHSLALFLLQDAVNGADQLLRLDGLDQVVGGAGQTGTPHGGGD